MHHIFIDFEMCTVPKMAAPEGHMHFEIIQFGAVMLDDDLNFIGEFSEFVKPQYGELTPEMTRLTGITREMLANQSGFIRVFSQFIKWLGSEDYIIYSWSGNDLLQLKNETRVKKFPVKSLPVFDKWVDFQRIFTTAARLPHAPSLSHALELMEIEFVGSMHFADADAYNTARLFRYCMKLKDFEVDKEAVLAALGGKRDVGFGGNAEAKKDAEIEAEIAESTAGEGLLSGSFSADDLKKLLGF